MLFATTKWKKKQGKKSKFELYVYFNKNLLKDEANIKTEIFIEYFGYQNTWFL